jgi:hypothetical protein
VRAVLEDISAEVKIWTADSGYEDISAFVRRMNGGSYLRGAAFYELTKREKAIQDNKMVLIQEKSTGRVYAGAAARDILRLPVRGTIAVNPGDHGAFTVSFRANQQIEICRSELGWRIGRQPLSDGKKGGSRSMIDFSKLNIRTHDGREVTAREALETMEAKFGRMSPEDQKQVAKLNDELIDALIKYPLRIGIRGLALLAASTAVLMDSITEQRKKEEGEKPRGGKKKDDPLTPMDHWGKPREEDGSVTLELLLAVLGFIFGWSLSSHLRRSKCVTVPERVRGYEIAGRLSLFIPKGTFCNECGQDYAPDDNRWTIDITRGLVHECKDGSNYTPRTA